MATCSKYHLYVIVRSDGSEAGPFDSLGEAQTSWDRLPEGAEAFWVAYHPVGVAALVTNPHTTETYCRTETLEIEGITERETI